MPVSLKQFCKSLCDSGLMSADEVREFLADFAPEKRPRYSQDLARISGPEADIYSLGCTLYGLLAGKPPYAGDSVIQILLAHREKEIPSLRDVRDDVPEQLDAVYQKMMAKRPDDRYQSMGEVAEALEACVSKGAAAVAGREASSDTALSSFLQNLQQQQVAPKKPRTAAASPGPSHGGSNPERSERPNAVRTGARVRAKVLRGSG